MSTVKATINGKKVILENVTEITQDLGDVTLLWDRCGGFLGGICPDCLAKFRASGVKSYCGRNYIAGKAKSLLPDTITVITNGYPVLVDDYEVVYEQE